MVELNMLYAGNFQTFSTSTNEEFLTGRTTDTGKMTWKLNTPVYNTKRKMYVALVGLDTYYAVANISADLNNNVFRWSADSGVSWTNTTIPEGNYSIVDLSDYIKEQTSSGFELKANNNTGKVYVGILKSGHQVDWSYNNLYIYVGADNTSIQTVSGYGVKIGDVNYMKGVNGATTMSSWVVHCSLLTGSSQFSYYKSSSDVISTLVPRVGPFNSVSHHPNPPIYMQVTQSVISEITLSITDQLANPLNFQGQAIDYSLHIIYKD